MSKISKQLRNKRNFLQESPSEIMTNIFNQSGDSYNRIVVLLRGGIISYMVQFDAKNFLKFRNKIDDD